MEEGVLEQWVLGWVLLSVLHVERGKWKDGRERVSLASATSTGAPTPRLAVSWRDMSLTFGDRNNAVSMCWISVSV
ncbi:hypothetical protein Tco_0198292 [Tanacetum coccineum]